MTPETKMTLVVLRQTFRKDLDQARSNLTGAEIGSSDHSSLHGVIATLTRVDNVLSAMIDTEMTPEKISLY